MQQFDPKAVRPQQDLSLLPVSAMLYDALKIFGERFWKIIGVVTLAVPAVVALLFALLSLAGFALGIFFKSALSGVAVFSFGNVAVFIAAFIFLQLVAMALQGLVHTALVYIISTDTAVSVISAYRTAWSLLLSYWWLHLIVGMLLSGGLLLFIFPVVVLGVWFSVALYVLVLEGHRGFHALFTSKAYICGRWWKVFWRLIVFVGILILGGIFVQILSPLFSHIFSYASLLLFLVYILLFFPFFLICLFVLYRELRRTKPVEPRTIEATRRTPYIILTIFGACAVLALFAFPLVRWRLKNVPLLPPAIQDKTRVKNTSGDELLKILLQRNTVIHHSDNLNISFAVPANWDVQERAYGGSVDIKTNRHTKADSKCGGDFGVIWIHDISNPLGLNIPDLYATFNDTSAAWPEKFAYHSFTSDAGLRGMRFPLINEGGSKTYRISCPARTVVNLADPKNRRVVSVHYFFTEDDNEMTRAQYQNLVNSLVVKNASPMARSWYQSGAENTQFIIPKGWAIDRADTLPLPAGFKDASFVIQKAESACTIVEARRDATIPDSGKQISFGDRVFSDWMQSDSDWYIASTADSAKYSFSSHTRQYLAGEFRVAGGLRDSGLFLLFMADGTAVPDDCNDDFNALLKTVEPYYETVRLNSSSKGILMAEKVFDDTLHNSAADESYEHFVFIADGLKEKREVMRIPTDTWTESFFVSGDKLYVTLNSGRFDRMEQQYRFDSAIDVIDPFSGQTQQIPGTAKTDSYISSLYMRNGTLYYLVGDSELAICLDGRPPCAADLYSIPLTGGKPTLVAQSSLGGSILGYVQSERAFYIRYGLRSTKIPTPVSRIIDSEEELVVTGDCYGLELEGAAAVACGKMQDKIDEITAKTRASKMSSKGVRVQDGALLLASGDISGYAMFYFDK